MKNKTNTSESQTSVSHRRRTSLSFRRGPVANVFFDGKEANTTKLFTRDGRKSRSTRLKRVFFPDFHMPVFARFRFASHWPARVVARHGRDRLDFTCDFCNGDVDKSRDGVLLRSNQLATLFRNLYG